MRGTKIKIKKGNNPLKEESRWEEPGFKIRKANST
jgi:hypothetical protein